MPVSDTISERGIPRGTDVPVRNGDEVDDISGATNGNGMRMATRGAGCEMHKTQARNEVRIANVIRE